MVIAGYKEEKYIGKCLDSVFREIGDDPSFEVIVVDNGSTDRTKEVVKRYPRVTLAHEPKPGANSARQAGFLKAQGEYIAHIDADTILPPGWVTRAFKAFSSDRKMVCISGPFIYYDLPKKIRVLAKLFYGIAFVLYFLNKFAFRRAAIVQGGNYVVRRSALEAIGGHNTDISFYGDDTDLACRLNKVGKVKFAFEFTINSSGRRLATEGAFTMGFRYGINYFWVVLFRRPFHYTSTVIRPEQKNGSLAYRPVNKQREWFAGSFLALLLLAILAGIGTGGYFLFASNIMDNFTVTQIKAEVHKMNVRLQNFSDSIGN